jgi:hypothetical protein
MKYYNLTKIWNTFGNPYFQNAMNTKKKPLPDNPFEVDFDWSKRDTGLNPNDLKGLAPYWVWQDELMKQMDSKDYHKTGSTQKSGRLGSGWGATADWDRHYCQATSKLDAWVNECNIKFGTKIKSRYLSEDVRDELEIE